MSEAAAGADADVVYHQRVRRERYEEAQRRCRAAEAECEQEWRNALNEEQALAAAGWSWEARTATPQEGQAGDAALNATEGGGVSVVVGDVDEAWAALFGSDGGGPAAAERGAPMGTKDRDQRRQRHQRRGTSAGRKGPLVVTLETPLLPPPPRSLPEEQWQKQRILFRDAVRDDIARLLGVFPSRFRDVIPHEAGKSVDVCIDEPPPAEELDRIRVRAQAALADDDGNEQRGGSAAAITVRGLGTRGLGTRASAMDADAKTDVKQASDNIFDQDWDQVLSFTPQQRAKAREVARAAGHHAHHYACNPCSVLCPFCERGVLLTGLVPHMVACASKQMRQQMREAPDATADERIALQYPASCAKNDELLARFAVLQDTDEREGLGSPAAPPSSLAIPGERAKRDTLELVSTTRRRRADQGTVDAPVDPMSGVLVLRTPIACKSMSMPAVQLAKQLRLDLQGGSRKLAGLRVDSISFPFGNPGVISAETKSAAATPRAGAAARLQQMKTQLRQTERALAVVVQLAEGGVLTRARNRARRMWAALRMAFVVIRQLRRHDLHFTCNPCSKLCTICGRGILLAGYRFHRKKCRTKTDGLVASDPKEENKVTVDNAVRRECAASLALVDDDKLVRKLREQRRVDYLQWRALKRPVPPLLKEDIAANDMAGCRAAAERATQIEEMVVAPICHCERTAVFHSDPRGNKVGKWSKEHVLLSAVPPPTSGMGSFWACARRDPGNLTGNGSCAFFEWHDGSMLTNPAAKTTRAAFAASTPATSLLHVVETFDGHPELREGNGALHSEGEDGNASNESDVDCGDPLDTRTRRRLRQRVDVSRAMASHEAHYSCHPCVIMCSTCDTPVVVAGFAQHQHACEKRYERYRAVNDFNRDVFVATASEYPLSNVCLQFEAQQPRGRVDAMLRQRRHDAWLESKRMLSREHKHHGPGETGHYTCNPCSIKCPVCKLPVLVHGFKRHRATCKKLAAQRERAASEGISTAGAMAQQYPYSTQELNKFEKHNPLARHRRALVGILHRSEKEQVGHAGDGLRPLKSDHAQHVQCNPCRVKCEHCDREVLANSYGIHREQCERREQARDEMEQREAVHEREAQRLREMEALNTYARLALCPSSVRATSSERRELALLNYLQTAKLPLKTNPLESKPAPSRMDLVTCGPFKVGVRHPKNAHRLPLLTAICCPNFACLPMSAQSNMSTLHHLVSYNVQHGSLNAPGGRKAHAPENADETTRRRVQRRQKTARQAAVALHTTQKAHAPAFMCRSGQFATSYADCIVTASHTRELQPGDRITAINDFQLPLNASLKSINSLLRTTSKPLRITAERQRQQNGDGELGLAEQFTAVCELPSMFALALQSRK